MDRGIGHRLCPRWPWRQRHLLEHQELARTCSTTRNANTPDRDAVARRVREAAENL